MEIVALIVSVILLGAFIVKVITSIISAKKDNYKILLTINGKEVVLSERADESDARKLLKALNKHH